MADKDKNSTENPAEDVLGPLIVTPTASGYYTGIPEGYKPPTGKLPKVIYDDKGNEITRVYYDVNNDANVILQTLSPKVRDQILTGLEQKITGYKKGTGFDDKDRSAFADLLRFANIEGRPVLEAYNVFMKTVPNVQKTSKPPVIRVTSEDDIKAVFRKTTNDLLGRDLGDIEATKFAKMYQNLQIQTAKREQAGGVVVQEPDIGVLAEKRIENKFAPQAQAYRAMQFMNIMDQSIQKLGA
jgi:hypothetical protein